MDTSMLLAPPLRRADNAIAAPTAERAAAGSPAAFDALWSADAIEACAPEGASWLWLDH